MSMQKRTWLAERWSIFPIGLLATLGGVSACAQIVGIEDTPVPRPDGDGGGENNGGSANSAGAAHAGASNAGTSNAGHGNSGGATASAGSDAGGADSGTAGTGGGSGDQAGSAGKANNAGSAGANECPCSAPTPTCENGKCLVRGPAMAKATSYYVDSTEISKAQYDVFLAAKANGTDTAGQIAECSWNTSYVPGGGAVDDARPIVNVDWCDAAAYCAWADKRLCGAIGGGSLAPGELNDATKNQMYLACGGVGKEDYPYGGFVLKPGYCNESASAYMADVGSFEQCQGHYAGIFDLVGNAGEWVDSCDTAGGADHSLDNCYLGGGSYIKDEYTCSTYDDYPRNGGANVFGFRCCSK